MSKALTGILKPLASLRLAVVIMAMSMVLIYAGTWAQVDTGIWQVQKHYFHSLFTWISLQSLFPRPRNGAAPIPGGFIWPGGYLLGAVLLVNLLAAHITRFKFTRKRIGIILIHLGLVTLLVGEGISSATARESQMILQQNVPTNYAQDIREAEFAVTDTSPADHDTVVAVSASRLTTGSDVRDARLPFDVHVDDYYPNSFFHGPMEPTPPRAVPATIGVGLKVKATPRALVNGTDPESIDTPSAYVTLSHKDQSLGTYLITAHLDAPQEVIVDGKSYLIELRFKRYYKPFSVELLKATHETYVGTNKPSNFASQIRLRGVMGEDRETKIWMNHPMYYNGETFYQERMDEGISVLQVVQNPAKWLPYAAVVLGATGLLLHFGVMLITFLKRNYKAVEAASARTAPLAAPPGFMGSKLASILVPAAAVVCGIGLALSLSVQPQTGDFDLRAFGYLPINDARVQPMDSLARNNLRAISGYETAELPGQNPSNLADVKRVPAIQWLIDILSFSPNVKDYRVIRIDHPEVKTALGLDINRKLFSFSEVFAQRETLNAQVDRANSIDKQQRGDYERKILELNDRIAVYFHLLDPAKLHLIPPAQDGQNWQTWEETINDPQKANATTPLWDAVMTDYHNNDAASFNQDLAEYSQFLEKAIPKTMSRSAFEVLFNTASPFFTAIFLYVFVFALIALSWVGYASILRRSALAMLVFTLLYHTGGLAGRVFISQHGPITNLYSSAIFIAWAGAVFCLALELVFRNGLTIALAAVIAIPSLIIAYCLSGDLAVSGDMMAPLEAVLDTNLWLWTHVICEGLGYSAAFVAGIIAVLYILLGVFTPALGNDDTRKSLARMTYGILCFAMIFSFVGTILGGIWADQSWGRFWGWDPKENGAVLIVLFTALVLHARWCGWARERGIATLAVFGNIVTSWSWFGTNMLGVGLHSYGFMDRALVWLLLFVVSQLVIIAIGSIPTHLWRSYAVEAEPKLVRETGNLVTA